MPLTPGCDRTVAEEPGRFGIGFVSSVDPAPVLQATVGPVGLSSEPRNSAEGSYPVSSSSGGRQWHRPLLSPRSASVRAIGRERVEIAAFANHQASMSSPVNGRRRLSIPGSCHSDTSQDVGSLGLELGVGDQALVAETY